MIKKTLIAAAIFLLAAGSCLAQTKKGSLGELRDQVISKMDKSVQREIDLIKNEKSHQGSRLGANDYSADMRMDDFLDPKFYIFRGIGEDAKERTFYSRYRDDVMLASSGEFARIIADESAYIAAKTGECIVGFGKSKKFSNSDVCSYPLLVAKAFARLFDMEKTQLPNGEGEAFLREVVRQYFDLRSFYGVSDFLIGQDLEARMRVDAFKPKNFNCTTYYCSTGKDSRWSSGKFTGGRELYADKGRTNQEFSRDFKNSQESAEAGFGENMVGREYTFEVGEITWFLQALDKVLKKDIDGKAALKALRVITMSADPGKSQFDTVVIGLIRRSMDESESESVMMEKIGDERARQISIEAIKQLDDNISILVNAARAQPLLYMINSRPLGMLRHARGNRITGIEDKRLYRYMSGLIARYEATVKYSSEVMAAHTFNANTPSMQLMETLILGK